MKRKKTGQGLVEYVLLVSLLALVCVFALTNMGSTINEGFYSNISTNLSDATTKINNSP
jgi:Flp pilus assembly pilin Flp